MHNVLCISVITGLKHTVDAGLINRSTLGKKLVSIGQPIGQHWARNMSTMN